MARWTQSTIRTFLTILFWLIVGGTVSSAPATPGAKSPIAMTAWSAAQKLSGDLPAWFPEVTMDAAGVEHVVWDVSQTELPTTAQGGVVEQSDNASLTYIRDYLLYQSFTPDGDAKTKTTDVALNFNSQ